MILAWFEAKFIIKPIKISFLLLFKSASNQKVTKENYYFGNHYG